jgi:hypothetical protein
MKKFTLFWENGKCEVVEGKHFHNAIKKLTKGKGSLLGLDFYTNDDTRENYVYVPKHHSWELKKEEKKEETKEQKDEKQS